MQLHHQHPRPPLRPPPSLAFLLFLFTLLPIILANGGASTTECPLEWQSALQPVGISQFGTHGPAPMPVKNDLGGFTQSNGAQVLGSATQSAAGLWWNPDDGRMAGGMRISANVKVNPPLAGMNGFALVLLIDNSADGLGFIYSYLDSNSIPIYVGLHSGLGYGELTNNIAIEVDFVDDISIGDGPVPHISIHTGYDGANNGGSGTRIGTQQQLGGLMNLLDDNLFVVQFDPTTNIITASIGPYFAVATLDPNRAPYFWSYRSSFHYIGFCASKENSAGTISISNFAVNTVPESRAASYLSLTGYNNTYTTHSSYDESTPQAIFYFKDSCGRTVVTSASQWSVAMQTMGGQPILNGTDGEIKWSLNDPTHPSQLNIYFYMKHNQVSSSTGRQAKLVFTLNNVVWSVQPTIAFTRVPPSVTNSILTAASIVQVGVQQLFTYALYNDDGQPAPYDPTGMVIKYGFEIAGWVEQTAGVNAADPEVVLMPFVVTSYPNPPNMNFYIKFDDKKVKLWPVSPTINLPDSVVNTCDFTAKQLYTTYDPTASNYIWGPHSSKSIDTPGQGDLIPDYLWYGDEKPANDVWIGSAWLNQSFYLGAGFTFKFTFNPQAEMAAVLFAGDHVPTAADYSPPSNGQDLTIPVDGYGYVGLQNSFAFEFKPGNSDHSSARICTDRFAPNLRDNCFPPVDVSNPNNRMDVTYDPTLNKLIIQIHNQPETETITVNRDFFKSPNIYFGFTAASLQTHTYFQSPSLAIVPMDLAQSNMIFTQTDSLTYQATGGFSQQPQAILEIGDQCGRGTRMQSSHSTVTVQMTIKDLSLTSPKVIHSQVTYIKSSGWYELRWYTSGGDQPFLANLTVTVNGIPIRNTALILKFVPSVPVKENSNLPPNVTSMVAGVPTTFQLTLRDQFNNLGVYDPNQVAVSYGVSGQTLTNVTQVNQTSPSTVKFSYTVTQIPLINPMTFIIKYGSAVWASYPIFIISGPVDPTQTKFSTFSSTQSVEASQSLNISTFDVYMNPVPAIVASINFVFLFVSSEHPSGLSAFTHGVKPTGSLGYNGNSNNATLTVTSNVAGTHSLLVYVNNQVVSKISILVTTTLTPISSAVISTMQTIDSGRTDLQPAFTLDIFDAYLNPISTPAFAGLLFEVAINHNQRIDVTTLVSCLPTASLSPPLPSITPVQAWCIWNNTKLGYSVFVNSSVAGQYSVTSISPVGVRNISSSLLTVIAGPVNAAKSSVQLVNSTFTAGTFPLTIVLRDGFGQLRFGSDDASTIELLLLDSDTGGRIDGAMALTSNGSASYLLTNPPTLAGSYVLSIYIAGSPLSLTPGQVKLKVIPGEVAPLRTIYSLNNVAGSSSLIATATKPFNFTLITRDSYDNQLDHGGAKIELIGFTLIDDVSTTATSTAGGGGGGGTGSRRRLLSATDSTYYVTDHTDGTYTIIVTFPDSSANSKVPFQLLINGANAVATPSITIQPADPCLFTERVCPVSKKCVSLYSNYTSLYSHVCNSIMTIQSITPSITGTNGGGAPITIILSDAPDLNQPVIISVRGPSHSFLANATTQQLTQQSTQPQQSTQKQFTFFLPPALTLGYGENEIPKGDSQGQQMSFTVDSQIDGIYYSVTTATSLRLINSSCFVVDYYWRVLTDECIPCPLNGYCPGGNQVYPLAGYYSNSAQDEEPKSCNPPLACKGYSVESFDSQTGKLLYDLASQCADGYQGKLCSQCDSAYYKDQQTCRSCGLDDTARRQLILVIILALVVFSVMALGVAFVDDSKLSLYIAVIVLIQHCSFVGSVGASHISASGLSEFFQFISLLNFEIAYFKLGCSVPQITYVKVFWATVLMIVIAAMMLILASGLFAMTRPISYLVEKEATRMKVWTRRMQNSLTILGVVVYLQMTTQFFKGLYCVDLDGQSVLQVEASTVCYEGGHLVTIIFIWPLLFIYSIGFPLLCCWLVLRTRRLNQWASSAAKYIYIYRGLKIRFIYFKCFNFITSFALALQITLSTTSNVTVRMATAFLFFSLDVFSIGVYWPYFKLKENVIAIAGGLANALSGLAILTILSAQSGLEEQKLGELSGGPLFAVGLAVLVALLLLICPTRYLVARFFPSDESPEDDILLRDGKYDELASSRSAKGRGTQHFETKKHAKKLAAVGKAETRKGLPHLDDAASFGQAGGADPEGIEIEMMHNPMAKGNVASESQTTAATSSSLEASPSTAASTNNTKNDVPPSNDYNQLHSPTASPPPLPFPLPSSSSAASSNDSTVATINTEEGLASPSRFASRTPNQDEPHEVQHANDNQ